jgi:hypothetical protein
VQALTADSATTTADYRRRARRIRASFANAPHLRQRALGELATQRNVETQAVRIKTAARRVPPIATRPVISVIEQGFADYAATKLQPYGFDFCDRVKLLDSAEQLGITRFRANMILALQEHHAPARRVAPSEVPGKSVMPSMLVILCIEIAIVGAMILTWNLFRF